MIQPVTNGYITSEYGYRVLNGVKQFHPGLDISCKIQSAPIYCALSGKIISIGWSNENDHKKDFGLRVWIKVNDNLYVVYGHLSLIDSDLKNGMDIYEGNQLGFMGNTGNSQGIHLHLEARSFPNLRGSTETEECKEFIQKIRRMYE